MDNDIDNGMEFRIMPSGGGPQWYWEVIHDNYGVVRRGLADSESAACQEATAAAKEVETTLTDRL
jgi:hypothetical protein